MTEGDLTLDEIRLAAAKRALDNATSRWAADYWYNVHRQLERNMKSRMRFSLAGGSERVSDAIAHIAWNH